MVPASGARHEAVVAILLRSKSKSSALWRVFACSRTERISGSCISPTTNPSPAGRNEEGFICFDWTKIGNLARYDTREKMKTAYRKVFPAASEASVRASYGQVFRFAHEIAVEIRSSTRSKARRTF